MNFSADSAAKISLPQITINTGNWFSGNNTNFGGSPGKKSLINITINTGNLFSNNNTNFGGRR